MRCRHLLIIVSALSLTACASPRVVQDPVDMRSEARVDYDFVVDANPVAGREASWSKADFAIHDASVRWEDSVVDANPVEARLGNRPATETDPSGPALPVVDPDPTWRLTDY